MSRPEFKSYLPEYHKEYQRKHTAFKKKKGLCTRCHRLAIRMIYYDGIREFKSRQLLLCRKHYDENNDSYKGEKR